MAFPQFKSRASLTCLRMYSLGAGRLLPLHHFCVCHRTDYTVGDCPISCRYIHNNAASGIDWKVMKCVKSPVVSALLFSRLLIYGKDTGKVLVFSMEIKPRIVCDCKDALIPNLFCLKCYSFIPHHLRLLCVEHPLSVCFVVLNVLSCKQFLTCRSLWLPSRQHRLLLLLILIVVRPSHLSLKVPIFLRFF